MEFIEEFAKLQDHVPSFDFELVRELVERELHASVDSIFKNIESKPVATASIGQVHRAVLPDGEQVAVKFQRPGIRKIVEVDLEIMLHLAMLTEKHLPELALHRPVKIVEEFARTLENEIDYKREATNTERVARQFLEDDSVYIPKVFKELTSSRILTTEFVAGGIKISRVQELDAAGLDRRRLCARGAALVLRQVFEHGFFHADPHPGNIFALPNDVICLLDFGMMGVVERQTREDIVDLVDAIVQQNETRTAQVLLRLTDWNEPPDRRQFERAIADFMGHHLYKPLKDIEFGKLLHELLRLATTFQLRIPPDLFLMFKALGTVESIGRMLDPDFDMVSTSKPFVRKVKMERVHPQRIADDAVDGVARLLEFLDRFPREVLHLFHMIRRERLSVKLDHRGLSNMLATHDRISNRLSFSIIIAALIIGSALIVISETPPLFYGISLIGIILFLGAAILGVWLLVAIIKKGL
jgi:ubiquinone biosynthesis protein